MNILDMAYADITSAVTPHPELISVPFFTFPIENVFPVIFSDYNSFKKITPFDVGIVGNVEYDGKNISFINKYFLNIFYRF